MTNARALLIALSVAAAAVPPGAHAQQVGALAARCAVSGAPPERCEELAVTAFALQGQLGLLSGLGTEVAGSAGTLGRRIGSSPRIAMSARTAFALQSLPDLGDPGAEPSREASFVVPSTHVGIAVGVFDGFSLLPTVGGLFGLDAFASTAVLFLPTAEGFSGKATGWSVGARVGLLRESFTLPGVSVSVSRRYLPPVRFGLAQGPGGGAVVVDPTVTSVRGTVGKDLLAVGLIAGLGWDRYTGSATLHAASGTSVVEVPTSLTRSRSVAFGGAALNFLVLQLSGEIGWARGFDVPSYADAPFDPDGRTFYGSLAFRLTI